MSGPRASAPRRPCPGARACSSGCGSSPRWSTSGRGLGEHPDWLLAPTAGAGRPRRNQYVLDIAHPEAWDYSWAARRPGQRVRHRLHQVGPQPRAARGRPQGRDDRPASTRRRWPSTGCLTPSIPPPVAGDRVVRQRRRTRRPGHPPVHRPGVDLGLQRSRRAAGHPALDGAADPARADGCPRRLGPVTHDRPDHVAIVPAYHFPVRARGHRRGPDRRERGGA